MGKGCYPRVTYASDNTERATGIEPALSAWEADVMPFHYARLFLNRQFF